MKKRAGPIFDDLTRQANEYRIALASDRHSTLRARRTTRSNSLLSGAPTFSLGSRVRIPSSALVFHRKIK